MYNYSTVREKSTYSRDVSILPHYSLNLFEATAMAMIQKRNPTEEPYGRNRSPTQGCYHRRLAKRNCPFYNKLVNPTLINYYSLASNTPNRPPVVLGTAGPRSTVHGSRDRKDRSYRAGSCYSDGGGDDGSRALIKAPPKPPQDSLVIH